MRRLDGRVALVTGATSGIGRAIAERLADEGAAAVVTDVQEGPGEEAAAGIRERGGSALYLRLDVADERSWRTAVDRVLSELGRLDVLVNNAAWATSRRSRRPRSRTGSGRSPSTRPVSSSG